MIDLIVSGQSYSLEDTIAKSTLGDLTALKMSTGIGIKTIKDSIIRMAASGSPDDFLDDEIILRSIGALVWLAKRRAGETLTIEQATDVPMGEVQFRFTVADEADEDPT